MKLLVALPESPDPQGGTASKYFGPLVRGFCDLGASVTVLAVRGSAAHPEDLSYFGGRDVRIELFDPPRPRPIVERKFRSLARPGWELSTSAFGGALRREADQPYDAILAELPSTAMALEEDPRQMVSLLYFRHLDLLPAGLGRESVRERFERLQVLRSEKRVLRRARRLRVLSQRMATVARLRGAIAEPAVIPLCLDPDLYIPVEAPETPTVGILGSMFWPPSRRAAEVFLTRIAPRLRTRVTGVRFIVGGWRAKEFLGHLVTAPDIELLDSFPDSRKAFAFLSVLVCTPPVGTGMKVKVLEAMAFGVPAVVNDEGWEGLEADQEPPVVLARTDDEIVESTVELLHDPAKRRRLSAEGPRCIRRSFSPSQVCPQLLEVLARAPKGRAIVAPASIIEGRSELTCL
ncbi:MAG: glycosyltransferase family 4 protein [Thermoanaerobaculia bacterium]